MGKSIEIEAASVDIAVDMALVELGLSKEDVDVEILSNGGLFQKAKIKVTAKEDLAKQLEDFINGTLKRMGLVSKATAKEEGDTISIEISGEDSSVAIGYRGDALDAFQYLALTFLNEKKGTDKKVVIDCEGYRAKRKETLTSLALKLAEKANRLARKIALEPMNPFERRIIHGALADSEIAKTESEGEEPNRYVVIIPTTVELKDERPIKSGQKDDKGNHQHGGKKNFKGQNNRPRRSNDSHEVEDGKVYRGYYTSNDDFKKSSTQGGPPKFKSFGGKKF